ncbi:MAG TPA: rod-binding protein, partial [Rhodocyclaceae bacterium]|nr:rod-binding protein [Rhodocyclaceae bacterium]
MNSADITPNIFDAGALAALKRQTKANDPAALKAAAQQFEALFLQMVLKSMRDATPKEGLFDSEQTRLYESLLDQQMGQVMAAKGGTGLAKLIESQLSRHAESGDPPNFKDGLPLTVPATPRTLDTPVRSLPLPATDTVPMPLPSVPSVPSAPAATSAATPPATTAPSTARDFIGKLWPHAADAGSSIGIPAEFLVGQAALETGWGRSELRRADGQASYNV